MALLATVASTDRIEVAGVPRPAQPNQITVWGWYYIHTLFSLQYLYQNQNIGDWIATLNTSGDFQFGVNRSPNTDYRTNDTPCATLNKWYFIACSYNDNDTPEAAIYVGDLQSKARESTYGTSVNGSGGNDASSGNFSILGSSGGGSSCRMGLSFFGYVNGRRLSLSELQKIQYDPLNLWFMPDVLLDLGHGKSEFRIPNLGNRGYNYAAESFGSLQLFPPLTLDLLAKHRPKKVFGFVAAAPAAAKNYYSGGLSASQRLNRGIGWKVGA